MPTAPLRPCPEPGCPALVGGGRCPAHQQRRRPWRRDPERQLERIRGGKLQHLRARLFDRHPLCVACEADGRVTIATIRDHVVPLAEGGRDDEANTQGLCASCHDAKSQREAQRGASRSQTTRRGPGGVA